MSLMFIFVTFTYFILMSLTTTKRLDRPQWHFFWHQTSRKMRSQIFRLSCTLWNCANKWSDVGGMHALIMLVNMLLSSNWLKWAASTSCVWVWSTTSTWGESQNINKVFDSLCLSGDLKWRNNHFINLTVLKGQILTHHLWSSLLTHTTLIKHISLNAFPAGSSLVIHFAHVWKHMTDSPITQRSEVSALRKLMCCTVTVSLGKLLKPWLQRGNIHPWPLSKLTACASQGDVRRLHTGNKSLQSADLQ